MRIGVDIDGTASNTIEVVYGRFFETVPTELLDVYDLSSYGADDHFFNSEWLYRKARPYKRSAEVLRALLADGHRLSYITARSEALRAVTEEWLIEYRFPFAELIMGKPKVDVIKEYKIELMIEDAPHEIERLAPVTRLIVLDRPYNRSLNLQYERVERWTEIIGKIG